MTALEGGQSGLGRRQSSMVDALYDAKLAHSLPALAHEIRPGQQRRSHRQSAASKNQSAWGDRLAGLQIFCASHWENYPSKTHPSPSVLKIITIRQSPA